ncbi:MAG: hypothetical protein FJ404_03730 [Verrucomicrobia bacterium]|nr:hypothetical protein [Verrucomicrobiota bacterium]
MRSPPRISRRRALAAMAAAGLGAAPGCVARRSGGLSLAAFSTEVTVPLGHGMMGGAWVSKSVADPLEARGIVLCGSGRPVVFVSVDWCEIRNDAYTLWQQRLASAAGTTPERVLLSTIHQHDAPIADLAAESLLRSRGLAGSICDPVFHEQAVRQTASVLSSAMAQRRRVSHVGTGIAKVERLASNRRYTMPDGAVRFDRTSATRNAFAIQAEEGLIDPWLRCLSFWDDETPLAALSFYAVHPMSYYGQGEVSADFPGLARRRRQRENPSVFQLYASGCSGNVTAGKYNDGSRENRPKLADRLGEAMRAAWNTTERYPVSRWRLRTEPVPFTPRDSTGFSRLELEAKLSPGHAPFQQCLAAMGLSWQERVKRGRPIQVPCLDLGAAMLLLLPGETYVEFQLAAQRLRPDRFVCVAGYGDGATGYVPTRRHWEEGDSNLTDWCWVNPDSESTLLEAMRRAMEAEESRLKVRSTT